MRQEGEDGGRGRLLHPKGEQFESRGVHPLDIFVEREEGLVLRDCQHDGQQGFKRLLSLPLGWDIREDNDLQAVAETTKTPRAGWGRQPQAIAPQCPFEFLQLLVWGIVLVPGGAVEQLGQGIQGRVLVIRGTATFPARMGFPSHVVFQHLHQAGICQCRLRR